MTAESDQLRELFVAALKLPAGERDGFLRDACAGTDELRERVLLLMKAHEELGSIVPSANVPSADVSSANVSSADAKPGATVNQPMTESPGVVIGPYKLIEKIGEGGMGTVWMAQQTEPVKRLVALKLIKAGMDSKSVIARFEAERQALALMDHPNIAKVFDGGATGQYEPKYEPKYEPEALATDHAHPRPRSVAHASGSGSSRPYFVMELVKGVPITKYCDEHHLTPRQRLELFIPVCHAIQHAHQKGIIHRDLKPSNVLIALYDGKPVPKVIDFGVAKAAGQPLTEQTLVTGFGNIIGTLEYMSPEQAELNQLDIDTRSDIYSLGVLLYELLTGSPPFSRNALEKAGMIEMLRVIREQEPSKPSTKLSTAEGLPTLAANRGTEPAKLTKLVRGELDWIVMKALEKDRSRRYETANGFAMDVQRYLADEQVLACPPSVGYRLRKFARRNKGPVLAVVLILLVLVGGVIGTTWGMMRAEQAKRLAEEERDLKDKARQLAETNEKLALKARDAERLALQGEAAQRRRAEENLKLATGVLDEIIVKPARQRMTLHTNDRAKGLAANPEREKLERELLDRGLSFYEKLAQNNATDWVARQERAKAYANMGFIQLHYKNYAESEKAYRQAFDLMEKLADERPDDFDNRYTLAHEYHWFYRPFLDSGRLQPAEESTRHALGLFEKLATDFPDRRQRAREGNALCLRNLGDVLQKAGKPREAEQTFQRSIAIWSELATANPNAAGYRSALSNDHGLLGDLYRQSGKMPQAMDAWRNAVLVLKAVVAETNDPQSRWQMALWQERLGGALADAGEIPEAEKVYRETLSLWKKLVAQTHEVDHRWHLAVSHEMLGQFLTKTGRSQEGELNYREARPLWENLIAEQPLVVDYQLHLSWNYATLVRFLRKSNKPAEASQLDAKLIELMKKLTSNVTRALDLNNFAWNLVTDPDPDFQRAPLAVELAKKAVDLAPNQGSFVNTLGTAYYRAGDCKAAIDTLKRAEVLQGGTHFSYNAFFIAMAHWQQGDEDQARKWYAPALIWMEKHAAKNDELIGFRAEAATLLGLPEKLTLEQEQAKADDVKLYTLVLEADSKAAGVWAARGSAYAERGQWKSAAEDFAKAGELNPDNPIHQYRQALVHLELGDAAGYRKLCADMLARLGPTAKADSARWVIWTCVLAADAVSDWKTPLRLAERAVADEPKSYRALFDYGAVLYRAGQYHEALKRLTEAETALRPGEQKGIALAYKWLFLAMAHQRLGHVKEAQQWHDKALEWIDRETQKAKEPGAANTLPWNRRLTLQLLRREAGELLKQQ